MIMNFVSKTLMAYVKIATKREVHDYKISEFIFCNVKGTIGVLSGTSVVRIVQWMS